MQDTIIAGTGNSRYIRSSVAADATWADVLDMLRAGTFPIDMAGLNLAGFTQLGTALNKQTLLSDAVISALGLAADAVPSEALLALKALTDGKLPENQGTENAGKLIGVGEDGDVAYISIDDTPAQDSADPVSSGGVYGAISSVQQTMAEDIEGKLDKDQGAGSAGNYMSVGADGILSPTAPDTAPTESSNKLITSGAVYTAVAEVSETAKTAVSYALAAFPTATASGAVAFFPDGADGLPVAELTVSMVPIQDLRGYDSPWPAGGGANIFDAQAWATLQNNDKYYTVNEDESITIFANDVGGLQGRFIDVSPSEKYSILSTFANNVRIFDSGSQTVLQSKVGTFTAPTDGKIAIKFYASTYPTTGYFILAKGSTVPTSWTPYSNICPISGRTGLTLTQTGKNLLPKGSDLQRNGIIFSVQSSGEVAVTGTATGNAFWGVEFEIPPGTYTLTGCPQGGGLSSFRLEIRDRIGGNVIEGIIDSGNGSTFSISEPLTAFVNIRIASGYAAPAVGLKISPMLRLASVTDAAFAPCVSIAPLSLSWESEAGTVYAGTLEVTSGVLTVTSALVDLGTLSWVYNAQGYFDGYAAAVAAAIKRPADGATLAGVICSSFTESTTNQIYNGAVDVAVGVRFSNGDIWVRDPSAGTDATAFKAAMSGVQLVYPLAAPLTFHLTAQEVKTLLGANSIWSDAGDTAVTYRVDPCLYISTQIKNTQNLIAGVEDAYTATQNYSIGDFFIVGNGFYRATAAIASGENITPGSNCADTTVAEQLKALFNS